MHNKMIGRNISVINSYSTTNMDNRFAKFDINKTEATALLFVNDYDRSSQTYINSYFLLNKSSMTKVINRLVKKGYVTRIDNENDKREKLIGLTEKGALIIPKIKEELDDWNDYMIENLTTEEKEVFQSVLYKVAKHITQKENY